MTLTTSLRPFPRPHMSVVVCRCFCPCVHRRHTLSRSPVGCRHRLYLQDRTLSPESVVCFTTGKRSCFAFFRPNTGRPPGGRLNLLPSPKLRALTTVSLRCFPRLLFAAAVCVGNGNELPKVFQHRPVKGILMTTYVRRRPHFPGRGQALASLNHA